MNILREIKTVLWSFIGIGGRDPAQSRMGNPLVMIAIAFVLVVLFLVLIAMVAKYAASP